MLLLRDFVSHFDACFCLFLVVSSSKKSYQKLSETYSAIEPPTWALLLAQSMRSVDYEVRIFDELSNLPPTLIQVSSSEMLFDDSLRYVAKAKEHGSEVKLQTWNNLPHVWQIFDNFINEAHDALDEISKFGESLIKRIDG